MSRTCGMMIMTILLGDKNEYHEILVSSKHFIRTFSKRSWLYDFYTIEKGKSCGSSWDYDTVRA